MNKYEEQFLKFDSDSQRKVLMYFEKDTIEFSRIKTIIDLDRPQMIRVVHDGKFTKYNSYGQFQNEITDLSNETIVIMPDVHFQKVTIEGINANYDGMTKAIKKLGFTGIKQYHLFLKHPHNLQSNQYIQITRKP